MSPDGTRAYITGGSNSCKSLAVIDTSTHTEIARIPMENAAAGTGGIPTELAITPDGRFVYVLRTDVGEIDTAPDGAPATQPSPVASGYSDAKSHIVMRPHGTRAYITAGSNSGKSLAV